MSANESDDELYGCPLWGADGSPKELDGAIFGMVDGKAAVLTLPLSRFSGIEPIIVEQRPSETALDTARFLWNAAVSLCALFGRGTLWRSASAAEIPAEPSDVPEVGLGRQFRAVELGAGTGVCACALARAFLHGRSSDTVTDIFPSPAFSFSVCATDLPEALPLAVTTAKRNSLENVVEIAPLDWLDKSAHDFVADVDLLFGADIMYSDKLTVPLLSIVRHGCLNGAVGLVAHEHRGSKADFESSLSRELVGSGVGWAELPRQSWQWSNEEDNCHPLACHPMVSIYVFALPDTSLLHTGLLAPLGGLIGQWQGLAASTPPGRRCDA
eukprot:TRINITY_DN17198_c0_g1_i1.p1 TRINITY_DN17198_c0_g1~~TRINITY_DN17198_c0_g1_i1.p1  ORF type:complete len:327 (+),score=46.77 TRINITY_DN17198_c0_g1_i1:44-1024(+)